ncbi:RNA polymerase sigma factor [Rhodocaloribacter litoris]|uniref:RNA polymerase sigma factor n=1 Tax=Rhodocaloribacter litoris TaxID=2558931 RepID=UPI001422F686|nr:RNA polymerase sigma factor [Rhodocaloribacter litoris]QXD15483.1 RNA polymerase sigma factor [Rhodocaloribacter litoris]
MNLNEYEQHVLRHQHRVYGLACYLLGNREEAEDVTQEVLLRLWDHRHAVDPERLPGWLLRVTRNACIDTLRRRQTYRSMIRNDPEGVDSAPAPERLPDAHAATTLFQEHLIQALNQLDEPYRSIVILREIQALKYEEISEALELPLNTVKVYLHRARKTLRRLLEEVYDRATV